MVLLLLGCEQREKSQRVLSFWRDSEVKAMMHRVSTERLVKSITDLESYGTRHTQEKQADVAEYILERLSEENVDVRRHAYPWKGKRYQNIEVVMHGSRSDEKYVVIGAHYDSNSEIPDHLAPGADDNASGVAGLLEVVRILKDHSMRNTLRIVFFSNEEVGQRGSEDYVKHLRDLSGDFYGAILVDMIGYGEDDEDLDVCTLPKSRWLALAIKEIGEMYDLIPMKLNVRKHCY
jgi:leucyl aminopeptidase